MPESRADFHDAPKLAGLHGLDDALCGREKRKLGTAPHEAPRLRRGIANRTRGLQIDAERFFGEEIFSGREHVEIHLFVQVVRHGHVDHIDIR